MAKELTNSPTLGTRGGVMGRPRKEPPEGAAELIEDLAADGWSIIGIAWKLGADQKTLATWREAYPELEEALEVGRERERQMLHNRLFRIAMEGSGKEAVSAAAILLNSRHGYRSDATEQGNRIRVTIDIPAALNREQYDSSVVQTIERL